jgi:N-acetylmuramoyl-L-alanine amidase
MREIKEIIVHCTATPEGRKVSVEEIDRWHKDRGWSGIGYHYCIQLDGKINKGRNIKIPGAHCRGRNKYSIGLTYVGGCDTDMNAKDTRTDKQKESLKYLIGYLCASYPGAKVYGHRDFSSKACPSYDAKEEYKEISEIYAR